MGTGMYEKDPNWRWLYDEAGVPFRGNSLWGQVTAFEGDVAEIVGGDVAEIVWFDGMCSDVARGC